MKRSLRIIFLSTLSIMTISGCCSSEQSACVITPTITCSSQDDRTTLSVGETNQLSANLSTGNSGEFVYTSLTSEILSVDEKGLVTALKKGTGRISVSLKEDEGIKKIVNFTVIENPSQTYEGLGKAIDDIKSYDYQKGVDISLDLKLDIGKVTGTLSSASTYVDIMDTSETSTNGRLSLPINLEVCKYLKEEKEQSLIRADVKTGEFLNDVFSRNKLISYLSSTLTPTIYKTLLDKLDIGFNDYLDTNDYTDIDSISFYSNADENIYASLNRDFTKDGNEDIHPYAFQCVNLTEKLTPKLLEMKKDENSILNSDSFPLDLSTLLTKDGLLSTFSLLSGYITETKEETTTILSLNDTAMKMAKSIYQDKIENPTLTFSASSLEASFSLPETITSIYLEIHNDGSQNHPFTSMSFNIKGERVSTKEEYTFLTLELTGVKQVEDTSALDKKVEFENCISAQNTFEVASNEYTIETIIKESDILYQAEKDYGADSSNTKLKEKKSNLLAYYYSKQNSEERRRLLYPLYRRITSLDCTNMDSIYCYAQSSNLKDDESSSVEVLHLYQGDSVDDFDYTLTSQDEEIMRIDANGNVSPVKAVYNGEVDKNNNKLTTNSATISVNITPKEDADTISSQAKSLVFTYDGDKKGFRTTETTFKDVEGFDSTSREYTIKAGTILDCSTLINTPSGSIVTYSSTDSTLAKRQTLSLSKFEALTPTSTKNLVGIRATVTNLAKASMETVVFYLRITND